MKKLKSVFLTSLIVGLTFAIVFLLYSKGQVFWAFAAMSVCILASYPLYYEKTEEHPVALILFSAPLMLLYAFIGMLIRYASASAVTTELVVAVVTAVLVYGLLFLVLYLAIYLCVSYCLQKLNF